MEISDIHPGFSELKRFLQKAKKPSFLKFIQNHYEEIPVWSMTSKCRGAQLLYGLWKDRYMKLWRNLGKGRCEIVTYNRDVWQKIEEEVKILGRTENAYRLQAYKIIEKMSHRAGQNVLQAIDQNNNSSAHSTTNSNPNVKKDDDEEQVGSTIRIKIPSQDDRYLVCGQDISIKFFAFQLVSKDNYSELFMDSNVHHILSLSSILLLQKNKYHQDLKSVFGVQILDSIYDMMQKRYKTNQHKNNSFDTSLKNSIESIIKNVKDEKIDRLDAMADLLYLCNGKTKVVKKVIKSVVNFIDKLPSQEISSQIMETELCHRYIDPLLSGLFDDPGMGVLFRWTSVTNQEAKKTAAKGHISAQRPDSCITEMDGLFFGPSLGFVEVKPASEKNNKYLVSRDMIRLGILSKNSLDEGGLEATMCIQVVDHKMSFFINKLEADGLYICTEIATFTVPDSINNLGNFLANFDDLIAILECYETWCVDMKPSDKASYFSKRRPSLSDDTFTMLSNSRSNKRRAVTMP
ncbi:hypothetical protein BDA99DRAFT_527777 [Phascolomyces articulosus]|uniref:Uncharacterized protein n=1 Tax=Phascolomyces articulosus TaxID=60185 RepID=A0AAD5JMS5_9FUNG|nr:hypothetical protein BDA99DRAFT_527777 [Phascolomyces articulosus]